MLQFIVLLSLRKPAVLAVLPTPLPNVTWTTVATLLLVWASDFMEQDSSRLNAHESSLTAHTRHPQPSGDMLSRASEQSQ